MDGMKTNLFSRLLSNWTSCLLIFFVFSGLQTRTFAAVLFRRIATKTRKDPITNEAKELFSTLTGEQRLVIRQKLVTCLTGESITDVRKKIGDAVAEIARQYTDNGMQHAFEVILKSLPEFPFSCVSDGFLLPV